MGDHPNGPSQFTVDGSNAILNKLISDDKFMSENEGKTIPVNTLFKLNPEKFLGKQYIENFGAESSLAFLFKVLSVRTALSI
jgi:mannose-6-phosphate isomerase class I